jgi:hypothetical protein
VVPLRVLSRTNLADSPTAPAVSPYVSDICGLFNSLCALFTTPVVCFQQLADSFCKTPGVAYTPRDASFRTIHFQTLSPRPVCKPVTPGAHCFDLVVLCFHEDTNCFFRKSFYFDNHPNCRGVWGASGGRRSRRRARGLCCLRNFWRRRITSTFDPGSRGGCRRRRSLRPCCA